MSHKKSKHSKKKIYEEDKKNMNFNNCNDDTSTNSNDDDTKSTEDSTNDSTSKEISSEDLQSLGLLCLQLRGIILDLYGGTLAWNATQQGISYILEKYDNIEDNEHSTTLAPDFLALRGAYISLVARLIYINIAFTRFNTVSKKKAEGTFKYSLQPNIYINIACVLSLIVTLYFIKAGQGIVARDNMQPIYGNV